MSALFEKSDLSGDTTSSRFRNPSNYIFLMACFLMARFLFFGMLRPAFYWLLLNYIAKFIPIDQSIFTSCDQISSLFCDYF